jgi:hypothetical protein
VADSQEMACFQDLRGSADMMQVDM